MTLYTVLLVTTKRQKTFSGGIIKDFSQLAHSVSSEDVPFWKNIPRIHFQIAGYEQA